MSRRTDRVNELIREELSDIILRGVKDPRVGHGLVSVTEVHVSPDLRRANVFVSHLGDESERAEVIEGLQQAAGFMHAELMRRLKMRNVPELHFQFDPTIEQGARLAALISQVNAERDDDGAE